MNALLSQCLASRNRGTYSAPFTEISFSLPFYEQVTIFLIAFILRVLLPQYILSEECLPLASYSLKNWLKPVYKQ